MSKKQLHSRALNEYEFPDHPRRNKKRSSKKCLTSDTWYNNDKDNHEPSEDEVPGMEYTPMFWQQPRLSQAQPHPAHNGQRLFTAMSDPSVCGYSAVPVTYAMEPVSLPPMYRLYQPIVRPNYRPYRGKTRTSFLRMRNGPPCSNDSLRNGYSSLQENGWNNLARTAYQNGDYASLPPTANVDNKDHGAELNSEHRRYSDPGLGPADIPINSKSEDTDSADSSSSITTLGKGNKLFLTLIEQMTKMKETNNQLFKELHQAKLDLENVRTELNHFKQNVPSDYQPGMLSDIIKEIRDASRVKEEVMLSKMKLLIESQECQRHKDLEELKSQLEKVRREKAESEERIGKLEKEVSVLRLNLTSENREIAAFEEENLALRRELQEARASRNLAESHATECVSAAIALGAVSPVNFESPYSPRITSTPVRTTFEPKSTDPSSSVGSLRSTDVNPEGALSASSSLSGSSLLDELTSTSTSTSASAAAAAGELNDGEHTLVASPEKPAPRARAREAGADDDPLLGPGGSAAATATDSCSTTILTSRVLTAPSRATYTTAYI